MATSHPSTILPPDKFGNPHTFPSLILSAANELLFRVSPAFERGSLNRGPGHAFTASAFDGIPAEALNNIHYVGPRADLVRMASAHINQWKDRTEHLPSPFVSVSCSFAYALFEARRWNARYWCNNTQITVIDATKITGDAWTATELVGAWSLSPDPVVRANKTDTFFGRWAEEVLVYGCIPQDAVIVTAPLESFFSSLPHWCADVTIQIRNRLVLRSTEAVADALAKVANIPANNTDEEQAILLAHSVERSIVMLRNALPPMGTFDQETHADLVEKVARLAAMFCWWPKWITRTDPLEYPALLERVKEEVLDKLRRESMVATMMSSPIQGSSDVVRSPATSPHERNPCYATPRRPVRRVQE
ncbi:hypothetical protein FB451DRAFT_511504 [Mycena latifolia]|nr:hypothetical protein FB451DRAFT_511504 [Mycena latifolia]